MVEGGKRTERCRVSVSLGEGGAVLVIVAQRKGGGDYKGMRRLYIETLVKSKE